MKRVKYGQTASTNTASKKEGWLRFPHLQIKKNSSQQETDLSVSDAAAAGRAGYAGVHTGQGSYGDSKKGRVLTDEDVNRSGTDYSVYILSAKEWIKYGAIGVAAAGVVAYIFYRSWIAFVILAVPAAVFFPIYERKDLLYKRRRRLAVEFREGITVLAASLAAGYSMENAMAESEGELRLLLGKDSIIVSEFNTINSRINMNIPIEAAWQEFADRSGLDDIRNFVQVIKVAKRSGGELNAIIAHSANTIGDKIQIKEEIITMTAAKSFEQKIMTMVPIAIVLYIDFTSPGFFDWLYSGIAGRFIMTACLAVYIAAIVISARILRIEV